VKLLVLGASGNTVMLAMLVWVCVGTGVQGWVHPLLQQVFRMLREGRGGSKVAQCLFKCRLDI